MDMVSFSTVSMVLVVVITQFVLPDIVGDYSIIGDKIKKIKTSYCRFL
ncbi:putative exported transmembrane protein [Bacteroides fragilis str. 3986 T(B)9]|nr:putative exported transmembrane protein [Bacteroides fragilis str. 3986 T(B)9]EYE48033.1 putative exported transmembrane protein [Bacteroides fragilis str. S23L17]